MAATAKATAPLTACFTLRGAAALGRVVVVLLGLPVGEGAEVDDDWPAASMGLASDSFFLPHLSWMFLTQAAWTWALPTPFELQVAKLYWQMF